MKKVDIIKHILVPKHSLLGQKEKIKLLEKYDISTRQLPKILKKDPAIKDLNPKVGDVIKITRQSPTSGEYMFYREVVNE